MSEYNVTVELPIRKLDGTSAEQLLEQFEDFHPAVSTSPLGWAEVTITVVAESMRQAIATALAVAGDVVSVTAMTTAEFDRRPVAAERMPELESVSERAQRLGITRQAVLQQLESGKLAGRKVGTTWVLAAATSAARSMGI